MIELTEQQQRELAITHEHPAWVINPRTQERFHLLPEGLYERVRAILEQEDEIDAVREMYPLVERGIGESEMVGNPCQL